MSVKTCMILSAGFGTRMGEIGKVLPKVLWPVFEKSLLSLQIKYARSLGCKSIYINTHYLSDKVTKHLAEINEEDVKVLYENPILDSGGAIHNLARQPEVNYKGNVLLLNGDQFFFIKKEIINTEVKNLNEKSAILFSIKVDPDSGYNETVVSEEGLLSGIQKSSGTGQFLTYSGVGIINLEKIERVPGASRFFETVAPFKSSKVGMSYYEDVEYWDFGTSERYKNSLQELLKIKDKSQFYKFLVETKAVNEDLINGSNYRIKHGLNNIVLDEEYSGECENSIIIKSSSKESVFQDKIVFEDIDQDIST